MCFKKDNGARSVSVLINTRSVSVSAVEPPLHPLYM